MLTFICAVLLFATFHTAACNEYAPFVTFNNGQSTVDKTCTDAEMATVSDSVMKAVVGNKSRRRLGLGKLQKRKLQLLKCYPLMAWATGKCGGTTYSRRLEEKDAFSANSDGMDIRELQTNICAANITKFKAELDAVAPKVSSKCRSFINARSFACRKVLDCDIKTFHTWNAGNNTIFKNNFPVPGSAKNLCSGNNWAFEAATKFDVGNVQLTLTGPNGYSYSRTEYQAPYYFFGNNGADVFGNRNGVGNTVVSSGYLLQVGAYTMTAVASSAPNSPHVAQFDIIDCK